ncbi:hypothetical protein LO762_30085 [Actinocorallia sp. API 0066]|uniref:hypothetical protein n=1 Tax=Actinocorallia sp. API 0066 TaxID=2896846 RepID=UPI001E2E65A0|nr:hypothetical protein [Actinocorallia sp. API 0066]MCD0453399.1 hypothetical protein [Actinocorallia sp. API 0066]
MADVVYPYDQALYSRAYLNCYQRQALVRLGETVPDVPLLFAGSLVGTDDIREQIIRRARPRYDFESPVLDPAALALLGVTARETVVDDYAAARDIALEAIAASGFALLVIDVFYLPHCVEYRKQHVVHTIMLTGLADGAWTFVDDNPASLLCAYTFPEDVVAAAFENGERRAVRTFTTAPYDPAAAATGAATAFAARLAASTDGLGLLADAADLLTSPWTAPDRAVELLYDALTVHLGARTCLREYVRRQLPDPDTDALLAASLAGTADLQGRLLIGKVTGTVDPAAFAVGARALRDTEARLMDRLRGAVLQRQ